MGTLTRKGYPRCDFLPWLGHQSLCRYQVPESKRHQCCCWVGAYGFFSLVALTVERLRCAVLLPSALLRTYTVDSSGEMPLLSWYVLASSFIRMQTKLNLDQLDHGYFISTAVWSRKWWPSTFCIPTGLWQFEFVFEWIPGRLAADLGVHWANRRTWNLSCTCFPSPVA